MYIYTYIHIYIYAYIHIYIYTYIFLSGCAVLGVTFLFSFCHVLLGIEPGSHMKPSGI